MLRLTTEELNEQHKKNISVFVESFKAGRISEERYFEVLNEEQKAFNLILRAVSKYNTNAAF